MPRPADAGSFAEEAYAALEPMQYAEPSLDYPLLKYLGGLGQMFQEVDDYVSDGPNGEPGWSILVDAVRAPFAALRWLGQFIGVRVPLATDDATARALITQHTQWGRGRPVTMVSALQSTLTGGRSVIFRERDGGDAYALTVVTRTSETPDSTASLNALLSQKPAGIILTYLVHDGQDYQLLYTNHADYAAVFGTYATYEAALEGP